MAGIDKYIGLNLEKYLGTSKTNTISFNELAENYKKLGYNHDFRRGFLRDVPKECRDIQFDIPKGAKLGKGFGIASTAMLGVTAYEDWKNNSTLGGKMGAIGIDGVGAAGGYGLGSLVGAGLVAGGTALALPEIAVGTIAVIGAGLVGTGAALAASKVKGYLGLR